jgi:hypothetical protein
MVIYFSNQQNVLLFKLASMISFPKQRSFFIDHIKKILFLRTQKQMIWINANRVVTSMANHKFFQDWPFVDFPRGSVCKKIFTPTSSRPNYSIAIDFSSAPIPAASKITYVYFRIESILEWCCFVYSHFVFFLISRVRMEGLHNHPIRPKRRDNIFRIGLQAYSLQII